MSTIKTIEDLNPGDVFITNYNDFPIHVIVESIDHGYVIPVDKRDFTRIKLLSYVVIHTIKVKQSKRRSKKLNRRYYLHQQIRTLVTYSSKNKTCFIPYEKQEELSDNNWITELRDQFGYSLQLTI